MFLDPKRDITKLGKKLPHWHQDRTLVFVTWRLGDALPTEVLRAFDLRRKEWERHYPKPWDEKTAVAYQRKFILPIEGKLDANEGSCILREHHQVISDALHFFDGARYDLDCFVAMPNHVHVVFALRDGYPLEDVMHSWKSFTANQLRKVISQEGPIWQKGYWDRLVRSVAHLKWVRKYIADNPKNLPKGSFALYFAER